jgi:hypothetical protein
MRPFGAAYWGLVAATVLVYAAMVFWSLPGVMAGAGGLVPFDMRPGGYSAEAARAFLAALDPAATARYLRLQHLLDTLFPPLMAASMALPFWWLGAGWPGLLRAGLTALPVLAGLADWAENGLVRAMLLAGPDGVSDGLIGWASLATVTKSALTASASVLLMILAGARLWRRWRAR